MQRTFQVVKQFSKISQNGCVVVGRKVAPRLTVAHTFSTTREAINCPKLAPAIGPFSHAVKAGNTIYVSGCIGLDPATKALVPGGVGPQARRVLDSLKDTVEHAGGDMSKVVKCTVLLTDMAHFAEVNAIYAEYFPKNPPARATFAVAGLPAGALVEIECICVV